MSAFLQRFADRFATLDTHNLDLLGELYTGQRDAPQPGQGRAPALAWRAAGSVGRSVGLPGRSQAGGHRIAVGGAVHRADPRADLGAGTAAGLALRGEMLRIQSAFVSAGRIAGKLALTGVSPAPRLVISQGLGQGLYH